MSVWGFLHSAFVRARTRVFADGVSGPFPILAEAAEIRADEEL